MNRELLDRAIQEHDTVTLGMHDEKYIQDLLDLKLFTNICLNKYVVYFNFDFVIMLKYIIESDLIKITN